MTTHDSKIKGSFIIFVLDNHGILPSKINRRLPHLHINNMHLHHNTTVAHKCKTNVSFQNKWFFSKQCLSFRNTLLFLQNKLHSFQKKCFFSKQMFHFKTNVSFQKKCFFSKQMFHFKTNVSFQNKCFISKQMFHFKTNVSFQNKCFISKQMFLYKTNVSFQNKCFFSKQMCHFVISYP